MSVQTLDGVQLFSLLCNGFHNVLKNCAVIDDLNVFPIPDGDTGKNMSRTLEGGVTSMTIDTAPPSASDMLQTFSKGSLFSARGNSGVILSQILRGFSNAASGKEVLTIDDFIESMQGGVDRSYSVVADPVEGTMLTVIREGTEQTRARRASITDMESLFRIIIDEMKRSLQHTPELLPVLKEAGVIDSGGAGLVYLFEGMLAALKGEEITADFSYAATSLNAGPPHTASGSARKPAQPVFTDYDPEDLLVYGYCTEFILQLQRKKTDVDAFDLNEMIAHLNTLGNSIVAVQDGTIVKIHVHSFEPEKVLGYARQFGELVTMKIENMTVQHSELEEQEAVPKPEHVKYAVIAAATGSGLIDYFKNSGVAAVVDGGQTNNPSTDDFIAAFRTVDADYIIVLPNDSNIIMAANQAAEIYKDAKVCVAKTKSLAEGYSAVSMMDLSCDTVEEIVSDMEYYASRVTTGYVTTATRDAQINGVEVKKGHYIGLTPDCILSDSTEKTEAALGLFQALEDADEKEVVTVICGKEITMDDKSALTELLSGVNPLLDIGFIDGGQDVYEFILCIE